MPWLDLIRSQPLFFLLLLSGFLIFPTLFADTIHSSSTHSDILTHLDGVFSVTDVLGWKSSLIFFFLLFNFSWNHFTNLSSSPPLFSQHPTYFQFLLSIISALFCAASFRSLHLLSLCPHFSDAQFYLFGKHCFTFGLMHSYYVHGWLDVASPCNMA